LLQQSMAAKIVHGTVSSRHLAYIGWRCASVPPFIYCSTQLKRLLAI